MKNQPKKATEIIIKMAHIMMLIETRIQNDAATYLPKQRSRFIDLITFNVTHHEDDFFTYDQIKQLVVSMVQRHESGAGKWKIATAHCTDDQVAVLYDQDRKLELIPINLFMAASNISQIALH